MRPDVAQPIYFPQNGREEIFLICYDGFVKNTSDMIVRTMKRESEEWEARYPELMRFFDMTPEEQYEYTMLFPPENMLFGLSNGKLSAGEIQRDLDTVLPTMLYATAKTTVFEFSLFQLLKEKKFIKCIFYRDMPFYNNDIQYVEKMYESVIDKIEFTHGGFLDVFREFQPTTTFLNISSLLFDGILKAFTDAELEDKMFIVLDSLINVTYDNVNHILSYREDFLQAARQCNAKEVYGIATMGNLPLDEALGEEETNINS